MDALLHDLRYAVRHILKKPGLPVVIVLSLAFAMGLSTSMFAVMNGVWFTPWSVPNASSMRIVAPAVTVSEWQFWREHSQSFAGLAAREGLAVGRLNDALVRLDFVSGNYFDALQVPMFMGRAFADETTGSVVIGHRFWQMRFGGDPNVVGKIIAIDPADRSLSRVSLTVVGVAAPSFDGPDELRTQCWLPLNATKAFHREVPQITAFGHLTPTASDPEAQAELSLLS